ncbi:glutathione S-transferase N-terminal domain-containing protein [Gluconobacter japonicus]|uniref:glutathione S-transferase N-terminal domain-containing protein n=1 Tax=Gluconobacter japonicus TaxID=376620 RepID=UPI000A7A6FEE|nr:glutathione S-transferase N-terminal domain-containing protein [Gluconobacter japonicus]
MFDLYAFATPNSVKVTIALEELELPYTLHGVNVRKGEQTTPEFLALNLNGKVPVLVETEQAFSLTESAAILVFLAEKTGRLFPKVRSNARTDCVRAFLHRGKPHAPCPRHGSGEKPVRGWK